MKHERIITQMFLDLRNRGSGWRL